MFAIPAFLCIYEIAAAGVTDNKHKELNISSQHLKRSYWCCNYTGTGPRSKKKKQNWMAENARYFSCMISVGNILLSLKQHHKSRKKALGFPCVSIQHLNICRIKMNVGLEQTALDHTEGTTPGTSSSTTSCCLIILYHYFP